MSSQREIRLNAFDMNCVGHQSPGLWAHPRDRSWQYKDLEYWVDLARLLERGKFDGLFIADVLGVYDVLNGNGDAAIRQAAQVPVNDPLALITPMALVTEHLGFGLTASLSFEHPYPFARRLSTLDHLTKGRVGWNIVTSYLESGARNIGQKAQTDHDARYDYADEYLEVVYKLLEGSWEDGAVLRDRERKIFSDPRKIHPINHQGNFFSVPAYAGALSGWRLQPRQAVRRRPRGVRICRRAVESAAEKDGGGYSPSRRGSRARSAQHPDLQYADGHRRRNRP